MGPYDVNGPCPKPWRRRRGAYGDGFGKPAVSGDSDPGRRPREMIVCASGSRGTRSERSRVGRRLGRRGGAGRASDSRSGAASHPATARSTRNAALAVGQPQPTQHSRQGVGGEHAER